MEWLEIVDERGLRGYIRLLCLSDLRAARLPAPLKANKVAPSASVPSPAQTLFWRSPFWFRIGGQERVVLPVDRPAGYIDSDTSLQHLVAIE